MDELVEKGAAQPHLIVVGEFFLDRDTIRVWRGDKPLQISIRQFRLLDIFMRHAGEPVSLGILKKLVWGSESTIEDATVSAEIARLRRAIGGRQRDTPIRTVRNRGYVFAIPKRRTSPKRKLSASDNEREQA